MGESERVWLAQEKSVAVAVAAGVAKREGSCGSGGWGESLQFNVQFGANSVVLWTMESDFILPGIEAGSQARPVKPARLIDVPGRHSESLRLFATTACCLLLASCGETRPSV